MTENRAERNFYTACAKILGVAEMYRQFPYRNRERWNNRGAGNGRFAGSA